MTTQNVDRQKLGQGRSWKDPTNPAVAALLDYVAKELAREYQNLSQEKTEEVQPLRKVA